MMTIHREGYKYITIATILLAALAYVSIQFIPIVWLAVLLLLPATAVWLWVVAFFRLPFRKMTTGQHLLTCPADGKVVVIEETYEPEYFKDTRLQVSIFMSPLNVHVNRNPMSGLVRYFKYHPGKYLVAWHPKSSTENERTTLVLENESGAILLRQIAGAMARRICSYVKEGDNVEQNGEFGFIRFGSRVDIFLPLGTPLNIEIGSVVKGGVTILAHRNP